MPKQTDTDPLPRAPVAKAAAPVDGAGARRTAREEDLSGEELLRGLANGPRAPFRALQSAQSDGNDAAQFHAGPRAAPRAHEAASPEPGIVLSPSVIEPSEPTVQRARKRTNLATVRTARVERRRTVRRSAVAALLGLAIGIVVLALVALRSKSGTDSSLATKKAPALPSATATATAAIADIPPIPPAPSDAPSETTAAERPASSPSTVPFIASAPPAVTTSAARVSATRAAPNIVQAPSPISAAKPSAPAPSARPTPRQKSQDDLPPEF
jgi:hypothetical protein